MFININLPARNQVNKWDIIFMPILKPKGNRFTITNLLPKTLLKFVPNITDATANK